MVVLDIRIEEMGAKITKKHKLLVPKATPQKEDTKEEAKDEEDQESTEKTPTLHHVGLPAQDTVTVTGRICLDSGHVRRTLRMSCNHAIRTAS